LDIDELRGRSMALHLRDGPVLSSRLWINYRGFLNTQCQWRWTYHTEKKWGETE